MQLFSTSNAFILTTKSFIFIQAFSIIHTISGLVCFHIGGNKKSSIKDKAKRPTNCDIFMTQEYRLKIHFTDIYKKKEFLIIYFIMSFDKSFLSVKFSIDQRNFKLCNLLACFQDMSRSRIKDNIPFKLLLPFLLFHSK